MRAAWFIATFLTACAAAIGFGGVSAAQDGNLARPVVPSLADYARRASLPNYLEAIRYIDSGMKYVDAYSGFYVSPLGQMCFRELPNSPLSLYDNYYADWCAYPYTLGRVEIRSDGVELWCAHAYPQCARRLAYPTALEQRPRIADSITIQVFPNLQESNALEYLIVAMGGGSRAW